MFFGQLQKEVIRSRLFATHFPAHPGEPKCDIHWFHSNCVLEVLTVTGYDP